MVFKLENKWLCNRSIMLFVTFDIRIFTDVCCCEIQQNFNPNYFITQYIPLVHLSCVV